MNLIRKDVIDKLTTLPKFAVDLHCYGALFTGGVVSYLIGKEEQYKDIDFIVPYEYWNNICRFLKDNKIDVDFNRFGGLRFKHDDVNYDIWTCNISDYLLSEGKMGKPLHVLDLNKMKYLTGEFI